MGVKDLNLVFSKCSKVNVSKVHEVVIIDGSNLIFQMLMSQLSKLRRNGSIIKQWDSIDMSLVHQMVFIIQKSIEDISNLIERYLNNQTKEIFIVMDPRQSPCYIINTKMNYNHKYEHVITNDDSLSNGETIQVNIKMNEQEVRRKRFDKAEFMQKEINYIHLLKEEPSNLSDDEINMLISIFKQSYCFKNSSEILRLSWIILKSISMKFHKDGIKIVDAIDEADLVIKNIANEFEEDVGILILSTDTDYNILFSDMPNVDVASLMKLDNIYNPHTCWKQILGDVFSYDVVIRFAPLLGNDYTVKENIVSAKNYEDVISLLNVNGKFNTLKRYSRKKIYKLVQNVKAPEGPTDLEYLDDIIYSWNSDYFKKYYISNIIYSNWTLYNKYNILEQQDEQAINDEIYVSLRKILTFCNEDYGEDETIELYEWNSNYFNNWSTFFDNLTIRKFSSYDNFIKYFHTISIENVEEQIKYYRDYYLEEDVSFLE